VRRLYFRHFGYLPLGELKSALRAGGFSTHGLINLSWIGHHVLEVVVSAEAEQRFKADAAAAGAKEDPDYSATLDIARLVERCSRIVSRSSSAKAREFFAAWATEVSTGCPTLVVVPSPSFVVGNPSPGPCLEGIVYAPDAALQASLSALLCDMGSLAHIDKEQASVIAARLISSRGATDIKSLILPYAELEAAAALMDDLVHDELSLSDRPSSDPNAHFASVEEVDAMDTDSQVTPPPAPATQQPCQ
jgi:hypothetical protein